MPFSKWRKFQVGFGKSRAGYVGLLDTSTFSIAGAGSVTTGASNLLTAILKANALHKNGQRVRITAQGKFAANDNTKQIRILAGSTELFDSGNLTSNDVGWTIIVDIVRTGSDTQLVIGVAFVGAAAPSKPSALTLDDGANQTIAIEGTGASSNDDVVAHILTVEVLTL
jgi:hypothetical protein